MLQLVRGRQYDVKTFPRGRKQKGRKTYTPAIFSHLENGVYHFTTVIGGRAITASLEEIKEG